MLRNFKEGAAVGITAFLLAWSPASGQITESGLSSVIREAVSDDDFVEEVLSELNLIGPNMAVFRSHFQQMFENDLVLDGLVTELVNNQAVFEQMSDTQIESFAQEYSAAWFQEKAVRGISRLSPSDQRHFFSVATEVMRGMPVELCADALRNSMDAVTSAREEGRALARLDEAPVARYLSIMRRAVAAEIQDDPLYWPLTPSEQRIAQQVYEQALAEKLLGHPNSEALIEAAEMNDWTPDDDVCDFGLLAIETGIGIEGSVGDWVVRYLSAP